MNILGAIPLGDIKGVGPFMDSIASEADATKSISTGLISTMIATITTIAGLAFLMYFIVGGLKWIVAGGDKTKVQEAQAQMTQAAVGLIAVTVSIFIAGVVAGVIGVDFLNPVKVIETFPTP
jgi:hypothetical protein